MFEGSKITIGKKEYPAVFNVVALQEVINQYGSLEDLGTELDKDYSKAIDICLWLLELLIKQGIDLDNFENGTDAKAPTADQLKLVMKPHEISKNREVIFRIINDGISSGEDKEEEVDEVLEEVLSSKNVTGAEDK